MIWNTKAGARPFPVLGCLRRIGGRELPEPHFDRQTIDRFSADETTNIVAQQLNERVTIGNLHGSLSLVSASGYLPPS